MAIAEYRGALVKSHIDGSDIRYFPSKLRTSYLIHSVLAIVTLILLVVGIVVSIYLIRFSIAGDIGTSNAQTVASICNAVQIQVMNYLYSMIARALTERENHR